MRNVDYFLFGLSVGILISVILIITTDICSPHPIAMDVYQGKTTLEITYKDGVPIDSVVVFKD